MVIRNSLFYETLIQIRESILLANEHESLGKIFTKIFLKILTRVLVKILANRHIRPNKRITKDGNHNVIHVSTTGYQGRRGWGRGFIAI